MTLRQVFTSLVVVSALLFMVILLLWIAAVAIGSGTLGGIGAILLLPLIVTAIAATVISDIIWNWTYGF